MFFCLVNRKSNANKGALGVGRFNKEISLKCNTSGAHILQTISFTLCVNIETNTIISNFKLYMLFQMCQPNTYCLGLRIFENIGQGFFKNQIKILALIHIKFNMRE